MATIHKEVLIDRTPEAVWEAFRDVGAIHTRLARQFVVDTKLEDDTKAEGGSRLVTFANGMVVRERIVTVDDRTRRLAYAVVEGRFTHHSASFQVLAEGAHRSRVMWTTDVLPNDLAPYIDGMMEQGCAAMKQTLESKKEVAV